MNYSLFFLKRHHQLIGTRVILAFIAFAFVSDLAFDTFHHHAEASGGFCHPRTTLSLADHSSDPAPAPGNHQPCQACHSHQHPVPFKEPVPQCHVGAIRTVLAVLVEIGREECASLSAAGSRAPPRS